MGKGLWMGLGILLLASAALLGCGREAQTQAEDLAYEEDSEAGFRRTVLYYTAEDGFVVPVMKRIPWEEGIGKAALGYLVDTEANRAAAEQMGLEAPVPEGASFTLRIGDAGDAVVDITGLQEMQDAAAEQAMVTGIVNTLTEFDSIHTVQITLDGAKAAALPHGTDISEAFSTLPLNVEEGTLAVSSGNAHPMTLYFPNAAASLNVPVTRYGLEAPTLSGAVEALLDGPAADGLRGFPEGTALLEATVEDGIARIDLSGAFAAVENTEGLCAALQEALYLTANEVEPVSGVDIYVEGEPYALHTLQVDAPVYVNEFK